MSVGLGLGAYGLAVLGQASDDPVSLAPCKVGSARNFDWKKRRYVVADDGGFEAMDETAQRVLLTVCFATAKMPQFITPQGELEIEQKIRDALDAAQLLDPRDPDIELDTVDVSHDPHATQFVLVKYKNLRTGTYQYIQPR